MNVTTMHAGFPPLRLAPRRPALPDGPVPRTPRRFPR